MLVDAPEILKLFRSVARRPTVQAKALPHLAEYSSALSTGWRGMCARVARAYRAPPRRAKIGGRRTRCASAGWLLSRLFWSPSPAAAKTTVVAARAAARVAAAAPSMWAEKTSGSGGTSRGGSSADGGDGSGDAPGDGGDGSGSGGEPSGGNVPLGGLCALSDNCSQAEGEAVCCQAEGCTAPCECTPASECPSSPSYLPCESSSDCAQFGGGRICCAAGAMTYCTKQNGCQGEPLP